MSDEIWIAAYLIAISKGCPPRDARDMAYQAVEDYEEFMRDSE